MKRKTVRLKAGMRVRVRSTASSPIAGAEGIVTYVGDDLCDVKVIKRRGAKVEESVMDTLPKVELESVYPHVDLVTLGTGSTDSKPGRWALWIAGAVAVAAFAWAILHWVTGV
ncbi:hypothetical protein [Alicyclobacillus ferrooxydans]|uniref:Uncharacterized protein n=1 Tax=Alicyclobacillus ferrooxydans TaxID=471514 RepID=A0A0P9D6C3_9BACL|nr:hypothetical protein [Alicyclobacillus ferrooxydans]KPV44939.1 hypothetical protein AN477_04870 [Alicyclobacillus ferrooxydans]